MNGRDRWLQGQVDAGMGGCRDGEMQGKGGWEGQVAAREGWMGGTGGCRDVWLQGTGWMQGQVWEGIRALYESCRFLWVYNYLKVKS